MCLPCGAAGPGCRLLLACPQCSSARGCPPDTRHARSPQGLISGVPTGAGWDVPLKSYERAPPQGLISGMPMGEL